MPPKVLRLSGKSTVEEIGIVPRDMPNIFVEAMTVADGKVHDEVREIAIPPESRVVDVIVEPSQTTYKPGQKAKVKLRLAPAPEPADARPVPFVGSTVVAVYDKSVEYISERIERRLTSRNASGSGSGRIDPSTESSLDRRFHNLLKPAKLACRLWAFGVVDPEELRCRGIGDGRCYAGHVDWRIWAAWVVRWRSRHRWPGRTDGSRRDAMRADRNLSRDVGYRIRKPALPTTFRPPPIQPVIRTNFADTAFWAAALTTAPDGTAEVEFTLPESLTTWKVKTWAMGPGRKSARPRPRSSRPRTCSSACRPRGSSSRKTRSCFRPTCTTSSRPRKTVQVVLELDGSVLEPLGETSRTVEIAAGSEHRVDWRVKVAHEGQAVIRMKALTDEESDAAQMSFPAYVHGMLKMEAFAGAIRPDQEKAQVVIPRSRRAQARAVAAGGAVFAHAGRCAGRCPALSRRLSLRLHRADPEPVPADGHHPEGLDQPGRST